MADVNPGGDLFDLLKANGYRFPGNEIAGGSSQAEGLPFAPTEGTTILALRYADGVVIAGDRRATAGNAVLYDRADKVIDLDTYSVLAISGSPAIAFEIARILKHSFEYHRRRQLQTMSLEAKLRRLSLLIRDNLPLAMQGIGAVIPIFATYDTQDDRGKIFFYDGLGAQFESTDFSTTGSGAAAIRGAMYYLNQWGERPFSQLAQDEVLGLVMRLLHTAAEYDSATGRYERSADIFPTVKTITSEGLRAVPTDDLREIQARFVDAQGDSER